MVVKISVLLVNLNNLSYTKQCIEDLMKQDVEFNLRLVDQNSSEEGTNDFLDNFFLQYNNGELNGKYKRWHSNGQIMDEFTYINGIIIGKFRSWTSNGILYVDAIF